LLKALYPQLLAHLDLPVKPKTGSEINFFLREPTGDYPKNFGPQMEGFGCHGQVVFFGFLLATPQLRPRPAVN